MLAAVASLDSWKLRQKAKLGTGVEAAPRRNPVELRPPPTQVEAAAVQTTATAWLRLNLLAEGTENARRAYPAPEIERRPWAAPGTL